MMQVGSTDFVRMCTRIRALPRWFLVSRVRSFPLKLWVAAALVLFPVMMSAQQTAVLDDFSVMRNNTCPDCYASCPTCLWQVVSTDQQQSIENGMYKVTGGSSLGVYFRFQPRTSGGYYYPANYALSFIKSGTWNADYNHLSIRMKCASTITRFSDYHDQIQWGTYIRAHDDPNAGNQGQHYYHLFNPNVYANKWITLDINRHPQWRVGAQTGTEFEDDPEWNASTQTSKVHYFDGITHFYPVDTEASADGKLNGVACYFDDATFRYAPGEPDGFVASVSTTHSGSAYEVSWSTGKNISTQYDVRYSNASMKSTGWSNGTSGGTVTTTSDTAWAFWSKTTPEVASFYVGIRPHMNVTAATSGTPIRLDTYFAHNLTTGDQVSVAGVCSAANGTRTVTVVDYNSLTLDGTSGSCSYGSGGTVTATSETKNFAEYLIGTAAASTGSRCDLNSDGQTTSADVQLEIDAALGKSACTVDLNGDGKCDVVDVQRVINASLGGACQTN